MSYYYDPHLRTPIAILFLCIYLLALAVVVPWLLGG
jgi:hypothetical protein